jgi:pimeloyl-ACP methyl ester carboxylesterase
MERYVEIRRPRGLMRGMLHLPPRERFRPPWPALALFHGFSGNRMESNFLFVAFSRLLAEQGIASVRFDFLGSGESDGRFEDMTLSSQIEDAHRVLDFLRGRRGVDRSRLFLLGLSMGGSIAGCVAGARAAEVRGLLLWAPAGEMSERIREREEAERANVPLPGAAPRDPMDFGGLRLGARFVPDTMQVRVLESTARYPGPVLIVQGTSDLTVPPHVAPAYAKLLEPRARLEWIEGADHTFKSTAWRERLYRMSLEFIREKAGTARRHSARA